jgi:hypothetical protein
MSKKAKSKPERELPLDDPRWQLVDEALRQMTARIGHATLAAFDLRQATMNGRVRSMRRYLSTGQEIRRELVPAECFAEPVLSANLDRLPRDLRSIHGWLYYVWKPDIDTLFGASPEEKNYTRPRRKPGQKGYTEDWPLHVAREVIRILQSQMPSAAKIPSAAKMSERCEEACGYHPDISAMQKMLKRLLG